MKSCNRSLGKNRAPKTARRGKFHGELLSLDPETEKRIERLGCRERLLEGYRNRINGKTQRAKTIEESVKEWRENIALLGD